MSYELEQLREKRLTIQWSVIGAIMGLIIIILLLYGCPQYNVYRKKMDGKATLAEANYSKEVAIAEARAKMESADLLAIADTLRAVGIAKSNKIIGESITQKYLHWFWIDNIDKSNNVIYVPTEANLPVLEAGKRPKDKYSFKYDDLNDKN